MRIEDRQLIRNTVAYEGDDVVSLFLPVEATPNRCAHFQGQLDTAPPNMAITWKLVHAA